MPNLFRFVYFLTDNAPLYHMQRDGGLFIEILPMLNKEKFFYKDSIFNQPIYSHKDIPIEDYGFSHKDILVLTTRPPMTDYRSMARPHLYKSKNTLEKEIFLRVHKYFDWCSRKIIAHNNIFFNYMLKNGLITGRSLFGQSYSQFHRIEFFINKQKNEAWPTANIRKIEGLRGTTYKVKPDDPKSSLVYLIFIDSNEETAPHFPKLLFVYGVGGQSGIFWARHLRLNWKKFNFKFEGNDRFILYEISTENENAIKTKNLDFVKDIKFRKIVDIKY